MLQCEIIGNLGQDAVVKEINERKYVSFSVADSFASIDARGVRVEKTIWVSVLWYGDGGRMIQYLKKGMKVFVRGRLSVREWMDRTGEKQVSLNISAGEVTLCGSISDRGDRENNESSDVVHGVVDGARRLSEKSDDLPY